MGKLLDYNLIDNEGDKIYFNCYRSDNSIGKNFMVMEGLRKRKRSFLGFKWETYENLYWKHTHLHSYREMTTISLDEIGRAHV